MEILNVKNINNNFNYDTIQSQCSNKAIIPETYINKFTISNEPLFIKIEGVNIGDIAKIAYISVQEFTNELNTIFLPISVLNDCGIPENTSVIITQVYPQTVTKIVFKNNFIENWEYEKKLLEKVIVNNYQILQINDIIRYRGRELEIEKLEPTDLVSCFNSDPEIEFNIEIPIKQSKLPPKIPPKLKTYKKFSKINKFKSFPGKSNKLL